jgi:hypothetical protein
MQNSEIEIVLADLPDDRLIECGKTCASEKAVYCGLG